MNIYIYEYACKYTCTTQHLDIVMTYKWHVTGLLKLGMAVHLLIGMCLRERLRGLLHQLGLIHGCI